MKRLIVCFCALFCLLILTTPAYAAPVRTQTAIDFVLAENSGCSVTPESYLLAIVNASSIYDCDATGGGTATALCVCDGGSIRGAITDDIASYVLITKAGQQAITSTGAGNDITFTSADAIINTAVGALTNTSATATNAVTTSFAVDAAGGTDELGIAENSVSVSTGIAFRLVGSAAPPVACAAGTAGTIYYDSSINKFCVCNATAYVLVDDATTTTGCS